MRCSRALLQRSGGAAEARCRDAAASIPTGLHACAEARSHADDEHRDMDERCIVCDHPKVGHFGSGCHRTSFLRGACDCDFVEPTPLPLSATAEEHRERAAWWAQRIDLTDRRIWAATHGSPQWQRLDRLRDVADAAWHHHLEMAHALPAGETDSRPAADDGEDADEGDNLLDLICIESIASQPAGTLDLMLGLFDRSPTIEREAVRIRLEAEFDRLEPRRRRAILEDEAVRVALEQMGVMTRLYPGSSVEPPGTSPSDAASIATAIDRAMGTTLEGLDVQEALVREFGGTIGDLARAATDGTERDRQALDEDLLSRYHDVRARLEEYWRHWAGAPSTAIQHASITRHPDVFQRQMVLAIQVLTPAEKARFTDRAQVFGWVASGMLPLFADGSPVPLEDVIETCYLVRADD
jgi:hypothetical protein